MKAIVPENLRETTPKKTFQPAIYLKFQETGEKMKSFPSFVEYMNSKGKLVEKPETALVPDYEGPEENSPPDSKVPYKTPVANKKPAVGEEGLADLGDEKLKYEPTKGSREEVKKDVMKESSATMGGKARVDVKGDYKMKVPASPKNGKPYISKPVNPGEKALGELGHDEFRYEPDTESAPKISGKTENFLNRTKGMSISEFTKYMLEECGCGQVQGDDLPYVTAYTTGKFQPHPPEVIRYISVLANKNDGILENLVNQMVASGGLGKLLKMIFSNPQSYDELVSMLGDDKEGPERCKSFVGAMNNSYNKFLSDQEGLYESVSSPMGFEDELDDEEEHEDHEGHHDEDDMEDEEEFDDEEADEIDDSDLDMDSEDSEDGEFDDEAEHEERKKLKKKFAHDHLLDAMRNHEHMLKKMRGN